MGKQRMRQAYLQLFRRQSSPLLLWLRDFISPFTQNISHCISSGVLFNSEYSRSILSPINKSEHGKIFSY